MNIFVVDNNPVDAARSLCDKHIVKMPVESAQMLSTTHRVLDGTEYIELSANNRRIRRWRLDDEREGLLYKASFMGHPCTKWTMQSHSNYLWHTKHAMELCREYTRRYGRVHKSQEVIEYCEYHLPKNINKGTQTPFAMAMPDEYKENNAVQSYRNYYLGEKVEIAKWKNAEIPYWFLEMCLKT